MNDIEIALDAHADLAEAPVWDPASESLLWVDLEKGHVHRFFPSTGADILIDVDQPVGAVAWRLSGGLVLAVRDGFALLAEGAEQLDLVAEVELELPSNRMNDGKCDPLGLFWAGTKASPGRPGTGALYRLRPDLTVETMLEGVTISNGIDWSPDLRRMYYVDSPTQGLDVFDFDVDSGEIANRHRLVTIPIELGTPDGLTVDSEGCIWLALWGGSAVQRYTPSGTLDRTIELPVTQVTSCAFGGGDLGDLYVTSASSGLDPQQRAAEPRAGAIFRFRPGVGGLPPRGFAG